MDCGGSICDKESLEKGCLYFRPPVPLHAHLCLLNGLLEFLLQAASAGRQGLSGTGRYLHWQLEILANHVARLAAVGLEEVQGCEGEMSNLMCDDAVSTSASALLCEHPGSCCRNGWREVPQP